VYACKSVDEFWKNLVEDVEAVAHAKKHTAVTRDDVESLMRRFLICLLFAFL